MLYISILIDIVRVIREVTFYPIKSISSSLDLIGVSSMADSFCPSPFPSANVLLKAHTKYDENSLGSGYQIVVVL